MWATRSRMELLSVKIAVEDILRQWPDAAYLQMEYSDQKYSALTPWTILDADGEVLDDDCEMWDELDNGANVTGLISNLSDDGGDWADDKRFLNRNAQDRLLLNRPVPGPQDGVGDHDGADQLDHRPAERPRRLAVGGQ